MPGAAPRAAGPDGADDIDSVARWILRHRRGVVATTIAAIAIWLVYISLRLISLHHAGYAGAMLMKQPWGPPSDPALVLLVDPDSPAERAGLVAGDSVVAVNGVPIGDAAGITALAGATVAGDEVTVSVDRDGDRVDLPLRLASPFDLPGQHLLLAFRLVMGLGAFFGVGLLVVRKRPGDVRSVLFFLFSSLLALSLVAIPLFEVRHFAFPGTQPLLGPRRGVPAVGFALMLASAFLAAPILLHFALLFPRPALAGRRLDRLVRWQYLALLLGLVGLMPALCIVLGRRLGTPGAVEWGGLLVSVAVTAWLTARALSDVGASDWREAVMDRAGRTCAILTATFAALVFLASRVAWLGGVDAQVGGLVIGVGALLPVGAMLVITVLVYPTIVCAVLWRAYRQATPEERRQISWPVWGIVLANVGALLVAVVSLWWALTGHQQTTTVSWLFEVSTWAVYSLIPVTFAVAILRYRLMDIDLIIRRTVIYGVVSTLVVAVYLVAVVFVSRLVAERFADRDTLTTILSTLAAAAAFVPLRTMIQRFVDARFFRTRYDAAQALRQLVGDLGTCDDVPDLATRALNGISRAIPTRTASLLAHVPGDPLFRVAAGIGLPDDASETAKLPSGGRLLDQLRVGPMLMDDVPITAVGRGVLERLRARLILPVREGSQVLGLITLGQKLSDAEFDGHDLEFLTAASAQVALAWRAVRLRGQERELQEALEIQRGLLPSTLPRVPGFTLSGAWTPARVVSGDYYDAWMVSPSTCAICIADVSGKGLPAALLMANLQAAVRANARADAPVDAICNAVNRAVSAHIRPGRFITFFFGLLDANSGRLRFVNAGHNPPLLARASGDVDRLSTAGIGLGMHAPYEYRSGETVVGAGDRLVLFTDGVTEALDDEGEEFGEDRLVALVTAPGLRTAEALQRSISDEVQSFTGGIAEDDVTVLAVTR